jgi:transcription elongation factor Elf1
MIEFCHNPEFAVCPHCGKSVNEEIGMSSMSIQPVYNFSDKRKQFYLLCMQCMWHSPIRDTTDELLKDVKDYKAIGDMAKAMLKRLEKQAEEDLKKPDSEIYSPFKHQEFDDHKDDQ